MSNIAPQTKKALAQLQTLYMSGAIIYPRVDNDFISTNRHDFFPHPKMNHVSRDLKPIAQAVHQVNKASSILFLSVARLLAPSAIYETAALVDYFFDDKLDFISEQKAAELENIIKTMEDYFRENNLKLSHMLKMTNEFLGEFSGADTGGMFFFHTEETLEDSSYGYKTESSLMKPSLLGALTRWDIAEQKKKKKIQNETIPFKYEPLNFKKIKDGLESFRIKEEELARLRRIEQEQLQSQATFS